MMAVYRISEKMRVPFGVDKHGWKITREVALYQCSFCPGIFRMQCRSESVTDSCGCQRIVAARKVLTGNTYRRTHNLAKTGTYKSWRCMKARCQSVGHIEYHRYGGRGISVCERWQSFENFLADMGERPEGHSIDRIDPNGNYEPSNCRWADSSAQARNRRNNRMLTIDGVTQTMQDWSELDGAADYKNIHNRLKLGWTEREAVFGRSA